jgi:glycosyltransferase involved in cell wall biosynthesis
MKLSVVMPVYNEERTILRVLEKVRAAPFDKEILVVDDGSTDGTPRALAGVRWPEITVLRHDRNRGKGAALRTGFGRVTGDVVLVQDADLEYDPADYPRLLKPILDDQADVVYGSRFGGETHRVLLFWHYAGNRFLTTLSNMLTNLNLSDMETGYKAFRASLLGRLRLKSNRFGFEPEFTAKTARLKCRIYEVPISYHGRTYAEGKKIGWRDGVVALWRILVFRVFG